MFKLTEQKLFSYLNKSMFVFSFQFKTIMPVICAVCLDELDFSKDHISATKCGHVFHKICLENWIQTTTTCPECRKLVGRDQYTKRIYANFSNEEFLYNGESNRTKSIIKSYKDNVSASSNLFLDRIIELENENSNNMAVLNSINETLKNCKKERNSLEVENKKLQKTVIDRESKLKESQIAESNYKESIKKLENQFTNNQNVVRDLERKVKKLKEKKSVMRNKIKEFKNQNILLENEVLELKSKNKQFSDTTNKLETKNYSLDFIENNLILSLEEIRSLKEALKFHNSPNEDDKNKNKSLECEPSSLILGIYTNLIALTYIYVIIQTTIQICFLIHMWNNLHFYFNPSLF